MPMPMSGALLGLALALTPGGTLFPAVFLTCHDGDTCRLNIVLSESQMDLGLGIWQSTRTELRDQVVRLCDINAPELATPDGPRSRDVLVARLKVAKTVAVELTGGRDKYGRLLGWLYADEVPLNQYMVQSGYAAPYKILCEPSKPETLGRPSRSPSPRSSSSR